MRLSGPGTFLILVVAGVAVYALASYLTAPSREYPSGRALAQEMGRMAASKGYVAPADFTGGIVCIAPAGYAEPVAKRLLPGAKITYIESDDSNGWDVFVKNRAGEVEVYQINGSLPGSEKLPARESEMCPSKIFMDDSAERPKMIGADKFVR